MFELFRQTFWGDAHRVSESNEIAFVSSVAGWSELIAQFGGDSFKRGMYRVIRATDLADWSARVFLAFPAFNGRITCFGYDWLGRAFAVDTRRLEQGQPGVVMFEPGMGEALEIPSNIHTFHENELIDHGDAALADDFHERWLTHGGVEPGYTQCVGYRKPLFLGGEDELENLELSDLDVYWHLMAQLIAKI
jgi:hypothetical protein